MDAPAVETLRARFDVDYRPKLVDDAGRARSRRLPWADAWIVRNRTQVRGQPARGRGPPARRRAPGRGPRQHRPRRPAKRAHIEVIPATGANAESVAEYVVTAASRAPARCLRFHARGRGRHLAAPDAVPGPRGLGQDHGHRRHRQHRPPHGAQGARHGNARDRARSARSGHGRGLARAGSTLPYALDELLRESDVVSLHVPLAPGTRGLLSREALWLMKRDADRHQHGARRHRRRGGARRDAARGPTGRRRARRLRGRAARRGFARSWACHGCSSRRTSPELRWSPTSG